MLFKYDLIRTVKIEHLCSSVRERAVFGMLASRVILIFVAGIFSRAAIASDDVQATTKDIFDSYKRQDTAIQSLRVGYRREGRLLGDPTDAHHFTKVSALKSETQTFAFKGRMLYFSYDITGNLADRYIELVSLAQLAGIEPAKSVRISANKITSFDGETFRQRNSGGDHGSILESAKIRQRADFNPAYLEFSGRWPLDFLNAEQGQPELRLTDAIEAGICQLLQATEAIAGHDCLTIKWNRNPKTTIWCDPSLAYAIRKIEVYHVDGTTLQTRTVNSDFKEVLSGIWMPIKTVTEIFPNVDAPEHLRNLPLIQYEYIVESLEVNSVPDSFFRIEFPPGKRVLDFENGRPEEVGEGKIAKQLIVAKDGSLTEKTRAVPVNVHPTAKPWGRLVFIIINILLLSALGIIGILKWRRAK